MKKIILLCISLLIICVGCFNSKSFIDSKEDIIKKDIREEALPIAKDYIYKKYGFNLIDKEIDNYSYPCSYNVKQVCEGLNGNLIIYAHHNNHNYKIEVRTSLKTCSDSYQKDDIIDSIKDYFSKYLNIDKDNFTLFVTDTSFLYDNKITSFDKIESLLGYYARFNLVTYEPIEEESVLNLINSFQKHRFNFRFFEVKNIDSYEDFIEGLKYSDEEIKGDYNYKEDPEALLNRYYTYEMDGVGGRFLDKKDFR